jgi:hypothetical protein
MSSDIRDLVAAFVVDAKAASTPEALLSVRMTYIRACQARGEKLMPFTNDECSAYLERSAEKCP